MGFDNMIKYRQDHLKALNNSVVIFEIIKRYKNQTNLIRVYKKFEKINRVERDVFYCVIYLGSNPILSEVVNFERTLKEERKNQIIKHLEGLK